MWFILCAILWFLVSFALGCIVGRIIEFGQSTPMADRSADDIF